MLFLAAGLAVAALAYSGLWYYAANRLETALPAWAGARRADGYDVAWRSAEIGGFPFRLALRLDAATATGERPVRWSFAADRIELTTRPWSWRLWHVAASDGVRLATADAGIAARRLNGKAKTRASGFSASIHAEDVSGSGLATGLGAAALEASLALPRHPPQTDRDMLAAASVTLGGATFPQAPAAVRHFDAISAAATMRGAMPPGPPESALAHWRDDGGTLDLDGLRFARDGASLDVTGTLALDEALQPEGAFTATLTGADKVVDGLVASGVLKPGISGIVKAVLRALASSGDPNTLNTPVTIQNRRIYVGPIALGEMPAIDWK